MYGAVRGAVENGSGCVAGWLRGQSPGGLPAPGGVRTQSVSQGYKELEEGDLEDSKKDADAGSKGHCAQGGNSLVVMGAVKTRVVSRDPWLLLAGL